MSDEWALATRLVHEGGMRSQFGETSEAMFLTQGFVYDSAEEAAARFAGEAEGYVYSRYGNPTVTMFERRMAALEGAEACRGTTSGMAAVTAALTAALKAGDHIVAAGALFGGCRYIVETYLPRFGVESTLVDGEDLSAWEAAVKPNTKAFFMESPTNPTLALVDIAGVAAIRDAKAPEAKVVVDNVFATPLWQSPLKLGADIVVYSATKHIDGQGRCLGGAILGRDAWIKDNLDIILRQTGPSLSPFNAWVLLKSLETLPLRIRTQTATAGVLADALATHKMVKRVIYPGRDDHPQAELAKRQMAAGSTLLAFSVDGGREEAFRVANALELVKLSNNLGDAKSLLTHPATTTHKNLAPEARAALGIDDGLLRLSVGLEDPGDLVADLTRALDQAAGRTPMRQAGE
ncbi:O-succinylhomoserine sulfhydrylase [Acuticoccus sp. I52.16.1]|uniref:O-succinylhomoserine sulfhydrylase n=1 Tax=Acuticoccus sp. I52.16.1 TaxID=2928472 RepID=UPI001FCF8E7A|nr:O-succinylhomoserine sulfhydrylase [Acuticoccus sp. I52.16.1]UOM35976.1 O-succinylhomoserine sulfhydrylase [Acuticoccus sp. I52.16.1]